MPRLIASLFLVALSITLPARAETITEGAVVERVQGNVTATSPDATVAERRVLQQGDRVAVGEFVRTAAGATVVLTFADGQRFRLAPNSTLKVGASAPVAAHERDSANLLAAPPYRGPHQRKPGETTLSR